MNSQILNKTQISICNLAIETFVAKQDSYLDDRINFITKLGKEISSLIYVFENDKITEAKYCKEASRFHKNVKRLIGKEKIKLTSIRMDEEYGSLISNNVQQLNLEYGVGDDKSEFKSLKFKIFGKSDKKYLEQIKSRNNKNINTFYFEQKLIEIINDETKLLNSSIAEHYLNLYKVVLIFNNLFYSKMFNNETDTNEKERSYETNNISESLEQAKTNFRELKQNLEKNISEKVNNLIKDYEVSYTKIESSTKLISEFSNKNISEIKEEFNSKNSTEVNKANQFYKGLFGNWNFFEDISTINYYVLSEFFDTRDNLNEKLNDEIISEFHTIIDLFAKMKIELEENKDSEKILDYLQHKKNNIKHKLEDDLLIQIVRLLPYDNPAHLIKAYLEKVKAIISKLPEERTITNLNELNYSKWTDLHTFSSKEIIEKNIFNSAFSNLSLLTKTTRNNIKKISSDVLSLSQISDYNFETAISICKSDDKTNDVNEEQSAFLIVMDGADRIINKCKDTSNQLVEISESAFDDFYSSVKKFTENLYKLNNADELIQLKQKLLRETAKVETQIKIENARTTIKNFFPIVFSKTQALYTEGKEKLFKISEKVGLSSAPKEVSEEILDYIIETEKQISSLPFIYQRLFKNTPVIDKRFFIGREKELEKIQKAYNHWGNGKFAPVVVVSEKGAGASSLTNMAQAEFSKELDVIHIRLSDTMYKPEDFLKLLCSSLDYNDITDFDELVDKILNNSTKRVIIIENIEDLFLRIVNGFDVIKKFAQIISLTNSNVFWIATCNRYAWNYLDKVINVDDYFAFVIRFDRFTNQNIQDIIMTRHSMSGYKLKFKPSINNLDDKQFQKLNEQQRQTYLLDSYFEELNKISASNVALAQLFWLRSISELNENNINISSLHNIDFSFLKNLNRQKVFSLAALLIHDGLTIEEHAKVFNYSIEESRLYLSAMLDDGELKRKDNNYRVNFLLYVHIVKLLKNQNILH